MPHNEYRRVRIDRLNKVSRNSRLINWVLRTGIPIIFVRKNGERVAYLLPSQHPKYKSLKKFLKLGEKK